MGKTRDSELGPRQAAFVREYLVDLNATQAAIRAGYSKKTARSVGQENLTKPDIKSAIDAALNERAKRTEVTADYVIATIKETIERCRQAAPVIDRKGEQVYCATPNGDLLPAYVFDSKGVLKGCELLGKHIGMFKERIEHTGKDGGPIETKEVSEPELARRIAFILTKAANQAEQKETP